MQRVVLMAGHPQRREQKLMTQTQLSVNHQKRRQNLKRQQPVTVKK